jgi:hypothetical protein
MGWFGNRIPQIAATLLQVWRFESSRYRLRVLQINKHRTSQLPDHHQLDWRSKILPFIHRRFCKYSLQKSNNFNQWQGSEGHVLFNLAVNSNEQDFIEDVIGLMDNH